MSVSPLALAARRLSCGVVLALLAAAASAQPADAPHPVLHGTVRDAMTARPIDGATVYVEALRAGTTTDADGAYRLPLPPDSSHAVRFSHVGYAPRTAAVRLPQGRPLDVTLVPVAVQIGEVDVEAGAASTTARSGVAGFDMEALVGLPVLLGEVDVNQAILQLPGVTSVGEGASGFNVRGGDVGQNLVLLDGGQVFFSSHLFGLFSLFNPDLVDDVTVYKAGAPARYGGRVGSVIEVRQRRAGTARRVSGNVGLYASRLALETPLGGGASAVVGARGSYANWLLARAERSDVSRSRAAFGDLGARVDVRPGGRLRGAASGYASADVFRLADEADYRYRTLALTAEATADLGPSLALTAELGGTDYATGIDGTEPGAGYAYDARVQHGRAAVRATGALGGRTLEAGLALDGYRTEPGALEPTPGSELNAVAVEPERGVEASAFVTALLERGPLEADLGLRYSLWTALGPAELPVLDPSLPRGPAAVIGLETFGPGAVVARAGGLEPRLAFRYAAGRGVAVRAGYDRLRQAVHLISNTTAPTPADRWALSNPLLPPQVSDQLSAGLAGTVAGAEASVEGYYRWLHRLVDYRPGATLLLNPLLEADLVAGRGRAYGVEVQLRKRRGPLTGTLAYTASRAERVAEAPPGGGPVVNGGAPYPADFDRPHDFSLSLLWAGVPRARYGLTFVYSSGRPITAPTGAYRLGDLVVPSYTDRNQARTPAYHRLDLSISLDEPHAPDDETYGTWTLSVYNVYGRRNAYSVFFRQAPGTSVPQAYRLSVLGSVLPSVSYAFRF